MLNFPTTEPGSGGESATADGVGDQWKYFQRFELATSEANLGDF
jgi:hypothetical protein